MLNSQVISFGLEEVMKRLISGDPQFYKDFESFSVKQITLKEAAIGIDRKVLYSWKKQGLLPHAGLPKKDGKDKSWGRFSFIELCWIRLLIELRSVGIGIDKLKEMTSFFYPEEFTRAFFSKKIDNLNESLDKETINRAIEQKILDGNSVVVNEDALKVFEGLQFSLFSCLLYATMLSKKNYILYLDGNKNFEVMDLDDLLKDPVLGVMEFHKLLGKESVAFVNIRKIIADLSGTHEHFSKTMNLGQLMSDSSVKFLRELFKDGQVREVVIRVNETGRPLVIIKREMSILELENQVRKARKKGSYFDLLVKTRDGDIKYFEQTEIIKL
jgi:hypothetical protein